jgi:tRNA threonylcarbamoyladenosine biosynthesis protein TsaE
MPPILGTRSLRWPDEAACAATATAMARQPALRDAFVELHGGARRRQDDLRAPPAARAGRQGRIKSPTYAVLEPYTLPGLEVSHFDFYRFDDPREWEDAGFREIFAAPGLKLAEWPEKAAGLLPPADLGCTSRSPTTTSAT